MKAISETEPNGFGDPSFVAHGHAREKTLHLLCADFQASQSLHFALNGGSF
jgi:hypothetical protein